MYSLFLKQSSPSETKWTNLCGKFNIYLDQVTKLNIS